MERDRGVDQGGAAGGRVPARVGLRRPVQSGGQVRIRGTGRAVKESTLTGAVLKWLNGLPGCYARKIPGGFFSSGWPDIVGCYGGRFFGIEMKRPGLDATALQAAEIEKWRGASGYAVVAHSVAEVKAFMAEAFHVNEPTKGARDE